MTQKLFPFMHPVPILPMPRTDYEAQGYERRDLWDAIGETPWDVDRGGAW